MNKIIDFLQSHKLWLIPTALVALIAPLTPMLDLAASSAFFNGVQFSHHGFYKFMFVWGLLPAWIMLATAGVFLLLSTLRTSWRAWRAPALMVIFTVTLGSGLITNAILKDHWGRPRPRQIEQFGGSYSFRPFYAPNFHKGTEPLKSFPCGHCTMGFCFFAVAIIGRRQKNKLLTYSGLILAAILGLSLGWTRIAQGGHFFSDVIVGALIMWIVALVMDWVVYED